MTGDAAIQFHALRLGQRQHVGFQAFPEHIQELSFFKRRQAGPANCSWGLL